MLTIDFIAKGMQYSIPNSWDGLTPYHFQTLMRDIQRFAEGKYPSAWSVRIMFAGLWDGIFKNKEYGWMGKCGLACRAGDISVHDCLSG